MHIAALTRRTALTVGSMVAFAALLQPTPAGAHQNVRGGSCDAVWDLLSEAAGPSAHPMGDVSVRGPDYGISAISSMAPVTPDAEGRFALETQLYRDDPAAPHRMNLRFGRSAGQQGQRFDYTVWVWSCVRGADCAKTGAVTAEPTHCRRRGEDASLVVDHPGSSQQLVVRFRR